MKKLSKTAAAGKAVTKALGKGGDLILGEAKHIGERIKQNIHPEHSIAPPSDIDFARLSKAAYGRSVKERNVEGFDQLLEYSSPDRAVYRHKRSGHVVISFRGTDAHQWGKGSKFFSSKGFRDTTTDAIMAAGYGDLTHRFYNAEEVTKKIADKYGKNNMSVTGHSLGGSQALHVSNKFKIHAEVYNPHIAWNDALTHNNYFHATIHVNKTDPVAALYPWVSAEKFDVRYNKKAKPFIAQHGIDNFLQPSSVKSNPSISSKPQPNPMGRKIVPYKPPPSSYTISSKPQPAAANPVKAPVSYNRTPAINHRPAPIHVINRIPHPNV